MRFLVWLFRAFIFFTLFAFALNNQQSATVRWFFGVESQAPMVFIVLVAFAAGCTVGVLAMVPSWWRHRRMATRRRTDRPATTAPAGAGGPAIEAAPEHPPREGL
jgi:lipopolysaccharide assembly protein A